MRKNLSIIFVLSGMLAAGRAQLAITEIVSSSSTSLGTNVVTARSDWWELSNFGTNTINLDGYKWNDNAGGLIGGDSLPFAGLTIAPNESILFVETVAGVVTNEAQFRAWWGTNLGATVKIRLYTGNGLGSGGDGVRVWSSTATLDADVIDSVDFGTAVRGQSYIYNTNSGLFTEFSTNGINGAFKAEETDDVGSPGINQGPVPLAISNDPTNQSVNPGDNATFSVVVRGLPRPKFQWKFNGTNIAGAILPSFTVTNAQISKTGLYSVAVFNGFQTLNSSNAALLLNAAPEPPSIITAFEDQVIYVGQSATFTIVASGAPQPRYQWRYNGNIINNATNPSHTISGASIGSSGSYSVTISNNLGVLTNQATLTVTPRPNLIITEVGSAQSTNGSPSGHNDWWELSNLDTFAVDLYGYKFDDNSITRAAAYTFTNHIIIAPGESIVLVEAMGATAFRRWWGPMNLKPDLKIFRYDGPNLSFSSTSGDGIVIWNSGAADDSDIVTATSFDLVPVDKTGVSFGYDPDTDTFGDFSVVGKFGAFQAMESDDVGSPGYLRTPPDPRIYRLAQTTGNNFELRWFGLSNRTFQVEYKDNLTNATWLPVGNVVSTNYVTTTTINSAPSPTGARFFRMSLVP